MANPEVYSSIHGIQLLRGKKAEALIDEPAFQRAWSDLLVACPWATSHQSHAYSRVWLSVYRDVYEPLLVIRRGREGQLTGLLPLAIQKETGALVHVGAHQAEYQVWLANEETGDLFIEEALDALGRAYPKGRLRLKYLPANAPLQWCCKARREGPQVTLRSHSRPILSLGRGGHVEESLRKKSTKSRMNRLKRIAPLKFVQIHTRGELEGLIEQIADFCDLRQGAIHSCLPFRDDPRKKEFWLRLLEQPNLIHASALMLGDEVIAAHLGTINRTSVSLGITAYSPFLAKHSPGKVLLLLLARELAQQGFQFLDLTPGNDEYKDRFADTSDEALVLDIYFNQSAYLREAMKLHLYQMAKDVVGPRARSLPAPVNRWMNRTGLWSIAEAAVSAIRKAYRNEAAGLPSAPSPEKRLAYGDECRFNVNCISDLLLYQPSCRSDHSRQSFFLKSLQHLEAGERLYTLTQNGVLIYCGWRRTEGSHHGDGALGDASGSPNTVMLLDDYIHAKALGFILYKHSAA